jgi:uncharacterized membrane protein SirB2
MALAIELYPHIKLAHMALVAASGALFALRGAAVLAGQAWPLRTPLRMASVAIDTALLVAGAALWSLLSLDPLRDAWLGMKLLLLVLYVVLGTLALKRARAAAYAAAIACFLFMVSVAIAHHPLGVLRALPG